MPKRPVLVRIAQVAGLAAAVAVVVAIVFLRGSDPEPPDPPREGARVFAGNDGWFMAFQEAPHDPREPPRVWLYPGDGVEFDGLQGPPLQLRFLFDCRGRP